MDFFFLLLEQTGIQTLHLLSPPIHHYSSLHNDDFCFWTTEMWKGSILKACVAQARSLKTSKHSDCTRSCTVNLEQLFNSLWLSASVCPSGAALGEGGDAQSSERFWRLKIAEGVAAPEIGLDCVPITQQRNIYIPAVEI